MAHVSGWPESIDTNLVLALWKPLSAAILTLYIWACSYSPVTLAYVAKVFSTFVECLC